MNEIPKSLLQQVKPAGSHASQGQSGRFWAINGLFRQHGLFLSLHKMHAQLFRALKVNALLGLRISILVGREKTRRVELFSFFFALLQQKWT